MTVKEDRARRVVSMNLMTRALGRARRDIDMAIDWVRYAPESAAAWFSNLREQRHYRFLTEDELRATRTSDTAFIFGSGYSINDITAEEWEGIARHNTIGFNDFVKQRFVRIDYHVVGELLSAEETAEQMRISPFYRHTIYAVQRGFRAYRGNQLIGSGLLWPGTRIFRYTRVARGQMVPPARVVARGLVHGMGSIVGVTNFAYAMGYRTIVLCGIDLYDRRYFWLGPEETQPYERPGLTWQSTFIGAEAIVTMLGWWRELMEKEGVRLFVMNPRSLLTQVMPVYDRTQLTAGEGQATSVRAAGGK